MMYAAQPPLFLASTSPYRKALLEKITPHFTCVKPHTDETPLAGESPSQLVTRLAIAKAQAVAQQLAVGLVIGSDQVAVFEQSIIGKPHTVDNAIAQLTRFNGKTVHFLTGLALINVQSGRVQHCVEAFEVHFRHLNPAEIEAYIEKERPLDCAGSFKSEGLGIALFEKLKGDDPNSLVGLPLIKLLAMLRDEGLNLLL